MDKLDLILEKLGSMEKAMDSMQHDIAEIKEDLAELKEDHSMTRDGVNTLLGWADSAARVIKVPLKSSQE